MLFSWKKSQIEKKPIFNKNNATLIDELKTEGIKDKSILFAIKKVPRKFFVEWQYTKHSYENIPLPIECEQTISQPYVVAYMISCLNLKHTDNVLEIGTGSGYPLWG